MNSRSFNRYRALGALVLVLLIGATFAGFIMPETDIEEMPQPEVSGAVLARAANEASAVAHIDAASRDAEPAAKALIRADWDAAHPEVYTRIAMAFDSEAMQGANLTGVQCRGSLCKVDFHTDHDIPVSKLLPMQLAESFHSMVTVHAAGANHVYVDIPHGG